MRTLFYICLLLVSFKAFAADDVYEKLFAELRKYAVVRGEYRDSDFPVLTGNMAMGGLTDPLGRGIYNIEVNDLYLNEKGRVIGPGMMLKMMQFAGRSPQAYSQKYDL
ncbi:MAG: hypothetical protein LBR49_01960, partial [Tannerella sp.]|nr:hypothetical protein [Tannerella sp.]